MSDWVEKSEIYQFLNNKVFELVCKLTTRSVFVPPSNLGGTLAIINMLKCVSQSIELSSLRLLRFHCNRDDGWDCWIDWRRHC